MSGDDLREKMARLKSVEAVRSQKQTRLEAELAQRQKRETANAAPAVSASSGGGGSGAAAAGLGGAPMVSKRSKVKGSADSTPLKISINVGGHEVQLKLPSVEDLEDPMAGLTRGQLLWRVDEALTTDFIQKKKDLNAERIDEEQRLMKLRAEFHDATDMKHQEAYKHRLLIDTIALAQLDEQRTRQALEAEQMRVRALLWELSNRAIRHRRESPAAAATGGGAAAASFEKKP
jgi:hypothetical protein